MLPNLKSLGVFAKVAETGSFSAASKALQISAPVVSQHISQLEETLDTALIYRSTRSLTLTDAGKKLARYANEMLDAAETGLEQLQTDVKEHSGMLNITAPSFLAGPSFTRILKNFCDLHPRVELGISYSQQVVNLIDSGFDLAIRIGDLPDSNLRARKLMEGHACLYASPELLAKYGTPKTPVELDEMGHPWIMPYKWHDTSLRREDDLDTHHVPKMHGNFHFDNGEADKQMAMIGGGVALLPAMYVRNDVDAGRLVRVLPGWITDPIGVFAVWPSNAGKRSLTRLFIDYLLEVDLIGKGNR